MKQDGLNTLQYSVLERQDFDLFTKINVDLQMTAKERDLTSVGDDKTNR